MAKDTERILEAVEVAKSTGKIKKGTNEVIKMGEAKRKTVEVKPDEILKKPGSAGEERRPERREGEARPTGTANFSLAWPARVEEVMGRTGTRGEAIQVR